MSVVAAGVHDALVATCVLQPRGFLDRQCIHVRAQTQRARAVATLELPDHTGSAQAALNVVTPVRSRAATKSLVRSSSNGSSGC